MEIKKLLEGLEIISKYVEEDSRCRFEHDLAYFLEEDKVNEEDTKKLLELGFFIEEECFCCFS